MKKEPTFIAFSTQKGGAGKNACVELQKQYGDKVIDYSHLYTGYKDLNEYLMSHKTRK